MCCAVYSLIVLSYYTSDFMYGTFYTHIVVINLRPIHRFNENYKAKIRASSATTGIRARMCPGRYTRATRMSEYLPAVVYEEYEYVY